MKALSVIGEMPETGEQVARYIEMATNEALSGDRDLLAVYKQLYAANKAIEGVIANIKGHVLEEAAKYSARGEFEAVGATFSIAQRTNYDYKESEWSKYKDALRTAKECEAFIKALKQPVFDQETGEEVMPVTVKVTETLTVKRF